MKDLQGYKKYCKANNLDESNYKNLKDYMEGAKC